MFLTGAIGMLCVYIAWIISVQRSVSALDAGTTNKAAGVAVLFFIYFYSPVSELAQNHSCRNFPTLFSICTETKYGHYSGTILETTHLRTVRPILDPGV
jgi:hypothetical protein